MFKGFIESFSRCFVRFCLDVPDGREVERCVLPGCLTDETGAAVDGLCKGFVDGVASVRRGWSSDATVRVAAGLRRGRAAALAMMHAGREAAEAFRECRRTTCAARCANMSAFRIARSSFRSWARTASRS